RTITPITIAIGEFSEHYFGLIGDMLSLTSNALQETSNAVTHYVNGQEEMALESQENAGVVPPPPPPPGSGPPRSEARTVCPPHHPPTILPSPTPPPTTTSPARPHPRRPPT